MKKIQKDFACNVFDQAKMKKYLSKRAIKEIDNAKENGGEISQKCVEEVAKALRKWAISRGATRYTHWFQPLNNSTAGKRDDFCSVNAKGLASVKFRGKELLKGEGDASSFPSGGLRQTFEARGINRWDFRSHPFVKDDCLFIPATFRNSHGEVLDKKSPLLNSCAALNKQAVRLLGILGYNYKKVESVVGCEQEYFLVDKEKFFKRPDLMFCGRTLFGAPCPKGQELCDHYYRPPNAKTLAFWAEVDSELWKLGIVAKTEHKEVAPNQFELAPCYQPVNIACDQNQIIMQVLQSTADKFGLVCLLHEKPFAFLNGSGKHNNWSLLTDDGTNLLEKGETAAEHARFALLITCILRAVDHPDLMRFAVASAANDCRLGGFEAPPQTFSVFLGELFDTLRNALDGDWIPNKELLPKHNLCTDRNRTSPFAFTGNKFEFRTVGSSASVADCNTILNTVVADSLKYFADELENADDVWTKAKILMKESLEKHGKIIFNGNNYSEEWKIEAEKRNLPNIVNAFEAAKCLTKENNLRLFEENGVLFGREPSAIQQIFWENYAETVMLENTLLAECMSNAVYPLQRYLLTLTEIAKNKNDLCIKCFDENFEIGKVTDCIKKLEENIEKSKDAKKEYSALQNAFSKGKFAADTVVPLIVSVRQAMDEAETLCPSELWTMPKYGDLLSEF